MGLDTSHGCWHGPYSAFSRWRNAVANAAGFRIVEENGFRQPALNFDAFAPRNFQGEWDAPPADPLLVLLVHSDCDGEIKPEHAGPLAERLTEIMAKLPERALYDDIKPATERFIAGLREAAAANESVEFA